MNKMKTIQILTYLSLLFSIPCLGQQSVITERSIEKTYDKDNLEASVILSRAEQWFGAEENAETYKIEVLDKNQGTLSANGVSPVLYKNIGTELYPKRSGMAEVLEADFGNRVSLRIDEGGYTIRYEVTDMKKEMYHREDLFYDCVGFEEIDEEALAAYNESMNKFLKANLVFKKRREKFRASSRSQFEEVSSYLRNEGELTIFSLHEAIQGGEL
ncbi:hypothetical protein [Lutimonas zeaxanthinifaciens]|uniref:hypothetical protein n=1 Tax=Lutimonas zeaxanthinifaciens TaxID=3060215 RepID=UPI00265CEACD|nr:hypothetical protein [Lutimonas sp. YSD2104]WKK65658.1 hypothetical protein QZH61_13845 [Lutimonas sp. YSD2104]